MPFVELARSPLAGGPARIHYRDGKPGYLDDTPRFLRYAREVSARYAALAPLGHLLDELEQRRSQVGRTF